MNFWSDGIDLSDFEKIVLGFLFVFVIIVAAIKYITTGIIDSNWVNLTGFVGGLFTLRKAVSYFKPQTYYDNQNNLEK